MSKSAKSSGEGMFVKSGPDSVVMLSISGSNRSQGGVLSFVFLVGNGTSSLGLLGIRRVSCPFSGPAVIAVGSIHSGALGVKLDKFSSSTEERNLFSCLDSVESTFSG